MPIITNRTRGISRPPAAILALLIVMLGTTPAWAIQNYVENPNFDEVGPRGAVTDDPFTPETDSAAASWTAFTALTPRPNLHTELFRSNFVPPGSALHMTADAGAIGVLSHPISRPLANSVFVCAWLKATRGSPIIVGTDPTHIGSQPGQLVTGATGGWQEIDAVLPVSAGVPTIVVVDLTHARTLDLDLDTVVETDRAVEGGCPHQWQTVTTVPHTVLFPKHPYPKIESGAPAIQDDSRPAIVLPPSIHLPDFSKHEKPLPKNSKTTSH